jgi:hypothetical protein
LQEWTYYASRVRHENGTSHYTAMPSLSLNADMPSLQMCKDKHSVQLHTHIQRTRKCMGDHRANLQSSFLYCCSRFFSSFQPSRASGRYSSEQLPNAASHRSTSTKERGNQDVERVSPRRDQYYANRNGPNNHRPGLIGCCGGLFLQRFHQVQLVARKRPRLRDNLQALNLPRSYSRRAALAMEAPHTTAVLQSIPPCSATTPSSHSLRRVFVQQSEPSPDRPGPARPVRIAGP